MFNLKKEVSLKQKIGIVLGGAFLTLSLGRVPAIAEEAVENSFTVEYLLDDDNTDSYKLIVVSDFEKGYSVITTVDLFEKSINSSQNDVIINGITFDKRTLIVSQLESYRDIANKEKIIVEDGNGLDFRYIYDEDHKGKSKTDSGSYDLIALSDYERNLSVVTSVSVFERLLEEQTGDNLFINGYQFEREKVLSSINRSLDGLDESLINREDALENSFLDVQYIYDDNHTGKNYYDDGDYRLVTVADYDSGNVVTMTPQMFEYVVNNTHGDSIIINNLQFDRENLLTAKEQADTIKDEQVMGKVLYNGIMIVLTITSSALKTWSKEEKRKRRREYGSW